MNMLFYAMLYDKLLIDQIHNRLRRRQNMFFVQKHCIHWL